MPHEITILRRLALAACLLAAQAAGAHAQPAPRPPEARAPEARAPEGRPSEGRRLPADSTTEHAIELPGRILRVTATAGSLPLTDPNGAVQAEIGYVAYRLAGGGAARPVTFAVNGGPGSASAYLHLLAVGPWRLPLGATSISPSASPALVPNAETWLDFTDLVFIDPVDTGYSRANGSGEEQRERYFSVEGDVASISAAIARWLRVNDRLGSPKFFLGESYGGFRGPLVARKLQTELGIGLSGLVLVSPVLDFGLLAGPRHAPFDSVTRLPSFAASRLERTGPVTREALAETERYASGEYLLDLTRGLQDTAAVERTSRRVAEITGLDAALVRRRAGRLDPGTFEREFRRDEAREVSAYDTAVSGYDPDPTAAYSGAGDPMLTAMQAPLTSAIVDHLARTLGWRVANQRYELSNGAVGRAWRYGRGRRAPDAIGELKGALALDGAMRVLVAHGLTDLVTPYFASELLLRQLPPYGPERRIALATYPGGHMFYTRDASRAAFRADAAALYAKALERAETDMGPLVYVLNGPNLNLLGQRQPEIYGRETLADVEAACRAEADRLGIAIRFHQSNREYEIIEWIHEAREGAAGIAINPAAFTHTSVAILDALNAFEGPVIEIHISNVHRREPFRHHSYVSGRADGVIAGFGVQGYALALQRLARLIAAG